MPMLDMPIKELERYLGSGIKAEDFNEYWDKQINEINEKYLDYEMVEKSTLNNRTKYYDIKFKGIDGANIYGKYICPVSKEKIAVVLEFHDYKEKSRGWHCLSRYAGINYAVLAMDCRGQGGLSEDLDVGKGPSVCGHIIRGIDDTVDNMYYRKVYLDAYILSKIAEGINEIDNKKIITFGKGQGAAIAIVVAALNKNIKKCSAQYPFLSDFKRVWDMDLDVGFYEGLRYYFRWFDSMHKRKKEIFDRLSYIDIVNFADRLQCELLLGTGLLDSICPPSTQYAFINNVKCTKSHKVFHKYGHEINNFFENESLKFLNFK